MIPFFYPPLLGFLVARSFSLSSGVRLSPPQPRGVTGPLIIGTDAVESYDV